MRLLPTLLLAALAPAQGTPGTLRWATTLQSSPQGTAEVWACPTVAPDGTIYLASHKYGGVLYRLRGSDGAILASRPLTGAVEHSVALSDSGRLHLCTLASPIVGQVGPPAAEAYAAFDLSLLWSDPMKNGADTSPILGRNDRVYLGLVSSPRSQNPFGGQRYYSYDASTGRRLIDLFVEGWAATPGVVDEAGRVFFGVEDITGWPNVPPSGIWPGKLYALAPGDPPPGSTTPTVLWTYATSGDFGSPISYASGVVYTTCRDGWLYGFRAADGTIVLQRFLGAPSWTGIAIGLDPSTGRRVLYTGTQSSTVYDPTGWSARRLYAIEDDGTLAGNVLWSVQEPAGFTFGTPALDDRGNLYYTLSNTVLRARDARGSLLWSYSLPGGGGNGASGGPTILDDGTIVCGSNGAQVVAVWGNGSHLADQVPWPKYKHDLRNTSNPLTPIRDRGSPLASATPTRAAAPAPITVQGSFFVAPSTVTIGGQAATVLSESWGTLVVQPPVQTPGFAPLTVSNALGTSTLTGGVELWPSQQVAYTGLGGTLDAELDHGAPGAFAWAIGSGLLPPPGIALPGIAHALRLDPALPLAVLAQGALSAAGTALVSVPVPNDPSLGGLPVHLQGLTVDPVPPSGASFTDVASITL